MIRHPLVCAALLSAALGHAPAGSLTAQAGERTGAGAGLPPGWRAQTDWSPRTKQAPSLADVTFAPMGSGYHATTGPAAIFWRDADTASGSYRVSAALTQTRNPDHPEAYGLLIGGRDLAGEGQTYTYLLVRPYDGTFSIRHRRGQTVRPTALVEWTAHEAVTKADPATGRATNELAVVVQGRRATFLINGTEVHAAAAAQIDGGGIVGYRVNHRLDVHLGPIVIRPLGSGR